MKLYSLRERTLLPTTLERAWDFFSSPKNLPVITPTELNFKVISDAPEETYAGLILHYTVTPLLGIPLQWVTEITQVEKKRLFIDEQRFGPYRFWHHQHQFSETADGVEMIDLVHYALHGDPLSRPLHALIVRPQLEKIFGYRRQKLKELFPSQA